MALGVLFLANIARAEVAENKDWRPVDSQNLLLIKTAYGDVAVELNPEFAPKHSQRLRDLAKAHFYDGLSFYRVIDGFVAQGGREEGALPDWPELKNENDRAAEGLAFVPTGSPDLYAPEAGHVGGFAAAQNSKTGRAWLMHCVGAMAMARDTDPDTGDAEFYIVIGPGTRYLDRNLTIFGRVIDGMEFIQKLNRGKRPINSGVIGDKAKRDPIISITLAADLPEAERPAFEVMRTQGQAFADYKTSKQVRDAEFFYRRPPEVIEACNVQAPVRRVGEPEAMP
ncbi:MAG: peptidylprolyl isomerase [Robiginitomaculum sp.]|nr:MAG: peptidylprolyl isomerase [Robiginitomaculum sp.]